jgi:hypothetical protein
MLAGWGGGGLIVMALVVVHGQARWIWAWAPPDTTDGLGPSPNGSDDR